MTQRKMGILLMRQNDDLAEMMPGGKQAGLGKYLVLPFEEELEQGIEL